MDSLPTAVLPPNASALRCLLAEGRKLDFTFLRDQRELVQATADPAWRQELRDPDTAALMLGQAIALWDANRSLPAAKGVFQALLDADAPADLAVWLPAHANLDPDPRRSTPFSALYGEPARCMPLEWFLACHAPNPQTLDPEWPLPMGFTRQLFDAVVLARPDIDASLTRFMARTNPAIPLPASTSWLRDRWLHARLAARLPPPDASPARMRL